MAPIFFLIHKVNQKKNGCHALENLRCFCHPEKNRVNFTGHPSNHFSGCRLNGWVSTWNPLMYIVMYIGLQVLLHICFESIFEYPVQILHLYVAKWTWKKAKHEITDLHFFNFWWKRILIVKQNWLFDWFNYHLSSNNSNFIFSIFSVWFTMSLQ